MKNNESWRQGVSWKFIAGVLNKASGGGCVLESQENKANRRWFCGLILAYTSRVSNYTMSTNIVSTLPTISTCRVILLLDMDAFYASVEQRDNPALQGQPVIVGYSVPRSIVTTASREARKFGIHSGMPMSQARKLCPHGHFIAPRMSHYETISNNIRQIVANVAGPQAILEPVALDEIYIDLTAYCSAATDDDALRLAFPYQTGNFSSGRLHGTRHFQCRAKHHKYAWHLRKIALQAGAWRDEPLSGRCDLRSGKEIFGQNWWRCWRQHDAV